MDRCIYIYSVAKKTLPISESVHLHLLHGFRFAEIETKERRLHRQASVRMCHPAPHSPPRNSTLRRSHAPHRSHRTAVHAPPGPHAGTRNRAKSTRHHSRHGQHHSHPFARSTPQTRLGSFGAGHRSEGRAPQSYQVRRKRIRASSPALAASAEPAQASAGRSSLEESG